MTPLFGLETEYGLVAAGPTPSAEDNLLAAGTLLSAIRRVVPALNADRGAGIFLANGARAYVDAHHLEYATPEVTDPWEAVRYTLAGDRLIERAIEQWIHSSDEERPRAFKGNVDYVGRQTWGSHESFLHRRHPREVSAQLMPHLVSRIVYTGAGGFDPFAPGVTFAVSPRALFMEYPESSSSMENRGIVHTKDEPLASGACRRLHLICGESLCSEKSMWLKSATTVLVIAMIDGGLEPAAGLALADPVGAFHGFARDPACTVEVRLSSGAAATALEMQRRTLALAEAHADAPFMPDWTRAACREWRATLDELARDPRSTATSLDWGIKRALFERVLARHGSNWELAAAWTDALKAVWAAMRPERPPAEPPDPETLLEPVEAAQARMAGAEAICRRRGLTWSELPRFVALRRALFECDMRFGELGERGLFTDLDGAGVLSHRVAGIGDVSSAVTHPPATTRARVRGKAVRELAANPLDYTCDWHCVVSARANTWLDLNEPFETEARWQPFRIGRAASLQALTQPGAPSADWGPSSRRELARWCYLNGNYGGATRLLEALLAEDFEVASTHGHLARLYLTTGDREKVRHHVAQAWDARADAPAYVVARTLWLQILVATLDSKDPQPWINTLKTHLARSNEPSAWSMEPVLDHLTDTFELPALAMMLSLYRVVTGAGPVSDLDEYDWWTGAGQAGSVGATS